MKVKMNTIVHFICPKCSIFLGKDSSKLPGICPRCHTTIELFDSPKPIYTTATLTNLNDPYDNYWNDMAKNSCICGICFKHYSTVMELRDHKIKVHAYWNVWNVENIQLMSNAICIGENINYVQIVSMEELDLLQFT